MTDPITYKAGDAVIVEVEGEKYLCDIQMASTNGRSLVVNFKGMIAGHIGGMALLYEDNGIYRSIINNVEATVKPLPLDWLQAKGTPHGETDE